VRTCSPSMTCVHMTGRWRGVGASSRSPAIPVTASGRACRR
jgi:hypothetical protein